jgi:hypothetical protein
MTPQPLFLLGNGKKIVGRVCIESYTEAYIKKIHEVEKLI